MTSSRSAQDPVAAAKILKSYADKVETFEIKAGFVDKKVIDAAMVNELADTPSKEVLIGKSSEVSSPRSTVSLTYQAKSTKTRRSSGCRIISGKLLV